MKFLFLIFIALGILFVFRGYVFEKKNDSAPKPTPTKSVSVKVLKAKTDEGGSVVVDVTPKISDEGNFEFEISMDTHSVALDQDMVAISKLVDDRQIEYKPTLWKGDGPGGHHRSGILRFGGIVPNPKSIKLTINSIGGVERNFSWDL